MFEMFKKKKDNDLYAPVTGEAVPLEEVPDKMFADKLMGDGIAFKFEGTTVCAPCDGEISMIANTLHAFGITASNGDGFNIDIEKADTQVIAGESRVIHFK